MHRENAALQQLPRRSAEPVNIISGCWQPLYTFTRLASIQENSSKQHFIARTLLSPLLGFDVLEGSPHKHLDSPPKRSPWGDWFLQRVLHWGERPAAGWILFLVAVVQSGFFPAPLILLFITFSLGALHRTMHFAMACAAGSIVGGCIAYFLGYGAWGVVKG